MESISLNAYAKINLHLDVTGRREDGYHTVHNVMQSVSLCDRITVTKSEASGIAVSCDAPGVPTDQKNLAWRAAQRWMEQAGISEGISIHIAKRIPMAAGLAGGSTDAAATLLALNRLYGEPLNLETMLSLGASLGADVPFCMVGGCCFADGVGEILHPFPPMPDCHLVIACGGEGVSTPWAYGALDDRYGGFVNYEPVGVDALRVAVQSGSVSEVSANIFNLFEKVILPERPVADQIRSRMLACGALGAMMSGSGPSVFGIFATEEQAMHTVRALADMEVRAFLAHPIASIGNELFE